MKASDAVSREGLLTVGSCPQLITTQQSHGTNQQPTPRNVAASEDVSSHDGETTKEVSSGKRTRWTTEMHAFLYKAYLLITKMETSKDPYTNDLHKAMINEFPALSDKTPQNISDQRRYIFKQNRLPQEDITRIRNEVARELGLTVDENEQQPQAIREKVPPEETIDTNITDILERNMLLYIGTDPTLRPKIPKLKSNKKNKIHIGPN